MVRLAVRVKERATVARALPALRAAARDIAKDQVVMPRGGGGIDFTVLASSGVHSAGSESVANTHVMSEPGRAALAAMRPAHPSRQSCSPACGSDQLLRPGHHNQPTGTAMT